MNLFELLSYSILIAVMLGIFGLGSNKFNAEFSFVLPVIGFVRFVLLSQTISVLTNVSLLHSSLISIILLSLMGLFFLVQSPIFQIKTLLISFFGLIGSTSSVLVIRNLGNSPFGTYNFDFIYGIQDAMYLRENSVLIPPTQGGGFPFDWGSVGIGRYCGIFLVTVLKSFTTTPIVAGAIIYALSIGMVFLSFNYFTSRVFNLSFKKSHVLSFIIMLSPLSLLGFQNQLIGQTSGLIVCILILALFLNRNNWNLLYKREFQINFGILIAGLFWIYPAQLMLLSPLFLFYIFLITSSSAKDQKTWVLSSGIFIGVGIVLLSISRDFEGTLGRIRALLFYSEAANNSNSVLYNSIFNQFSSLRGPIISSGLRIYGDTSIFWPLVLVYFSVLSTAIFFRVFLNFRRAFTLKSMFFLNLKFVFIVYCGVFYLIFFITQQNYLLFKLSTWFSPVILLILSVDGYRYIFTGPRVRKYLISMVVPSIILNFHTSYTIYDRARKGNDIPFVNSNYAFDESLRAKMMEQPGDWIYMPSMEEAAWITFGIPNDDIRESQDFLGVDNQSLYLGFNRNIPDWPDLKNEEIVYLPTKRIDIFPEVSLKGEALWQGEEMMSSRVKDIERHFSFGIGAFYPDRKEVSPFVGKCQFRWSNGYLSFGIYSSRKDSIDLGFPIHLGPDFINPIDPTVNNGVIAYKYTSENELSFTWKNLNLEPGWNSFSFQINDAPIRGVPRNSLRPDFRPLAIAIGEIIVTEKL